MREKFYVFLDIDGVMYDWEFLKSQGIKSFGRIKTFNPDSVQALNYLLETLNQNHDTELVISSTWRRDMLDTVKTLKDNGVKMNLRRVFSTPIFNESKTRGKEILSYLSNRQDNQNYVIIDDEVSDIAPHFDSSKIIQTNIFTSSLKKSMVDKFLKENHLTPTLNEERSL